MPETPDFDQIARAIVKANDNADGEDMDGNPAFLPIDHKGHLASTIAEQLRLVWNARGAADLATVRTRLLDEGAKPDGPAIKMCEVGIRLLDH